MISHEELWQRFVATRDPALREQLTLQYAPLVKYVINSMSMMVPVLATMEDMIGYGTIGAGSMAHHQILLSRVVWTVHPLS